MKLEISEFKISKDDKEISLTSAEAKELCKKLTNHFGLLLDMKSGTTSTNNTGLLGDIPYTFTGTEKGSE